MDGLSRLIEKEKYLGKIMGVKVLVRVRITHLLFVDDVLLFGRGSISEWRDFHRILCLFSKATGLMINLDKSSFLSHAVDDEMQYQIKDLFNIHVIDLELGFKYLGFFLKPNCYATSDWIWLIQKVEKKIGLWCHRWISLGGRLILVKVVLEGLPVYWLSVTRIPREILDKIHRRIFSFLWTGKKDKESVHLVAWNKLVCPKSDGGWGLRNLNVFGTALAEKSLWRCLFSDCLWSSVIKDKYIRSWTIDEWFRQIPKNKKGASISWNWLLSVFPVVSQWLAWIPGNGWSIKLGEDPIVEKVNFHNLSEETLSHLHSRGIFYLAQDFIRHDSNHELSKWLKDDDLLLQGAASEEWNDYVRGLSTVVFVYLIKRT
jgi:hypothetical protein